MDQRRDKEPETEQQRAHALDYCTSAARAHDLDRYLACLYAPPRARAGLFALTALDLELASVLRTTTQELIGEMRLVWWRDALGALDEGRVPLQPILQLLAAEVLPAGVTGEALSRLEDGFWRLLAPTVDGEQMEAYAAARGGVLFGAMLRLMAPDAAGPARAAAARLGEGWALAELVRAERALPDAEPIDRRAAARLAAGRLAGFDVKSLGGGPARRVLGGLARLVAGDLAAIEARGIDAAAPVIRRGSPARQLRLLWGAIAHG